MLDAAEVLQFLHHSLHVHRVAKSEALKGEDEGFAQKVEASRVRARIE